MPQYKVTFFKPSGRQWQPFSHEQLCLPGLNQ